MVKAENLARDSKPVAENTPEAETESEEAEAE